jgi:hypothetical protein
MAVSSYPLAELQYVVLPTNLLKDNFYVIMRPRVRRRTAAECERMIHGIFAKKGQ